MKAVKQSPIYLIIGKDSGRVVDIVSKWEYTKEYKDDECYCMELYKPTGDIVIGDTCEKENGVFATFADSVLRNLDFVQVAVFNMRNGISSEISRKILKLARKCKKEVTM